MARLILIVMLVIIASLSYSIGTRLRYRRHFNEQSKSMGQTNDNENHNPVFSNCSKYAPEIYEESPRGTVVIKVQAEDHDLPEKGGTITYILVFGKNENPKFEINATTGLIQTTKSLERDYPENEKVEYLTVLATDNGEPHLDAICSFNVTIKDVNDNAPLFDKWAYAESIPKDFPLTEKIMRVSATDIDDGNNSVVVYSLSPKNQDDDAYFRIDKYAGDIFLTKQIDKNPGYKFTIIAKAHDLGDNPKSHEIEVDISVVEAYKKAPSFRNWAQEPIRLLENFSDFHDTIVKLEATSNIVDKPDLLFELVAGRTEQTNNRSTFRVEQEKNFGHIKLSQCLDYEKIAEYTLIMRVTNKYNLAAETKIKIEVLDVNDNIPVFQGVKKGSVLENEAPGVPVMQVQATDADGTSANNQVTYELENFTNLFAIDKYTGKITTLVTFDREVEDAYLVKIMAVDNSPSALLKTGQHNKNRQRFTIVIADRNDNAPHFTQVIYKEHSIPENVNMETLVTEVKAVDNDTASFVTYSIVAGNTDNTFYIEGTTGKIRVNKPLDYELITAYNLTVKASDGLYDDTAQVEIFIQNLNGSLPVFKDFNRHPEIEEETLVDHCITNVSAYDPDIKDREADQHIAYSIVENNLKPLITIDKTGCMKLKKPLDRDPPNGHPVWTIQVTASANDGLPTGNSYESIEVNITLIDKNDNAPFLAMRQPIIWYELKQPGNITKLKAHDYDSDSNGPPFEFRIDGNADDEIKTKFFIFNDELHSNVTFDREQRKNYAIPITISDNGRPPMTGTSTLTVIIVDVNDHSTADGSSSRFFYNYKGEAPDTHIGRACHAAEPIVCLNGGTPFAERCECQPGFEGPRCELLGISFHGDGWAIITPPGQACADSHLGLELIPQADSGLVFYFGPMSYSPKLQIHDFMWLEIQQGYPVLYVGYGTVAVRLNHTEIRLTDGMSHRIDVYWTKTGIEMMVDNCDSSACLGLKAPAGTNKFLHVNGPLLIGGAMTNLSELSTNLGWIHKPTDKDFVGCIRNITIDGNTCDLGMLELSKNVDSSCHYEMAKAVSLIISTYFLVAILLCITIFLILLLAVVIYIRRRNDLNKKMDDIRGYIINYEDEEGGNINAGYDLNVPNEIYDAPPLNSESLSGGIQTSGLTEGLGIRDVLDSKKETCDEDSITNPFDDLRHYAYEGEKCSDGSLSSLSYCTDDDDSKYDSPSNFGPKFRKLADMYGEEPSDEDSDGVGDRKSGNWFGRQILI